MHKSTIGSAKASAQLQFLTLRDSSLRKQWAEIEWLSINNLIVFSRTGYYVTEEATTLSLKAVWVYATVQSPSALAQTLLPQKNPDCIPHLPCQCLALLSAPVTPYQLICTWLLGTGRWSGLISISQLWRVRVQLTKH